MIRFLTGKTVAGHRYGRGAIAMFDSATEAAVIGSGDAVSYPAVVKPMELLASSAVAASCSSTASDEVLASAVVSGIGPNSILQIEPLWTFSNSANNKILKVKVGSATVYNVTRTTVAREAPLIVLANRNSLTSQIQPYDSNYFTSGTGSPLTASIDFSGPVTVQITGQRANAGDALTLEYFRCLHFLGD